MGQEVSSPSTSQQQSTTDLTFYSSSAKRVTLNKTAVPRLVIAIEFGSSRYGYQYRSEYERVPLDIHINTQWQHGGICANKLRSALLLKPDLSLEEFGYAAERKFSTIQTDEEDGDNWYYFEGFKMTLYHNRDHINSNTTEEDVKGRHVPATLVFGRSIQYIKEHVLNHMRENGVPYIEEDTKWVITVPVIWTDRAKGLMREAATEVCRRYWFGQVDWKKTQPDNER